MTRVQVRLDLSTFHVRVLKKNHLHDLGLQVTWPTSYEALVGRAELKPGTAS